MHGYNGIDQLDYFHMKISRSKNYINKILGLIHKKLKQIDRLQKKVTKKKINKRATFILYYAETLLK